MKQPSAEAYLRRQKAAKQKKTPARKSRSRREIFLTVTDTLADWLEQKMKLRGETKPQPFIYELLQQRREKELAQTT